MPDWACLIIYLTTVCHTLLPLFSKVPTCFVLSSPAYLFPFTIGNCAFVNSKSRRAPPMSRCAAQKPTREDSWWFLTATMDVAEWTTSMGSARLVYLLPRNSIFHRRCEFSICSYWKVAEPPPEPLVAGPVLREVGMGRENREWSEVWRGDRGGTGRREGDKMGWKWAVRPDFRVWNLL